MTANVVLCVIIPFSGTCLGSAMVFFLKEQLSQNLQRVLSGFAAGVMVAASVWSLLIPALSRAQGGNAQERGNVFFITDEFSLLPNLEHIDDAVNFGRSLGIKFMIGVQNVEQIYDNYGEARARSIMSGFLTNISFRVTDGKSREYIQQLYGKSQISESYTPMNKLNGAVEHQREANVVEDWDITTLRRGQAIVGLQNAEPFLFQFSPYSG